MKKQPKKVILFLIICCIEISFLSGCDGSKKIYFYTKAENKEIELYDTKQNLKVMLFDKEGNTFMEEKVLQPLMQKYKDPSADEELGPYFFYTITSTPSKLDPYFEGIVYVGAGCGVVVKFSDFKLNKDTKKIEIFNEPNIHNIYRYVCS